MSTNQQNDQRRQLQEVYTKTERLWAALLRRAEQSPSDCFSCDFRLTDLLARMPALPNKIQNGHLLQGFSTWRNGSTCQLQKKTEPPHTIPLRCGKPVWCDVSEKTDFQLPDRYFNNGLTLLVLAWCYIFNASLAERQCLKLEHVSIERVPDISVVESAGLATNINLDYASQEETSFWAALLEPNAVFKVNRDRYLPWTIALTSKSARLVQRTDKHAYNLPPAEQAAKYLQRLCTRFKLAQQCHAALAVAIVLPSIRTPGPRFEMIVLPRPSLDPINEVSGYALPEDFARLDHYLTFSLCTYAVRGTMESVFWQPNISCELSGAVLHPISKTLTPLFQERHYGLLARLFSPTKQGSLWLGMLICGRGSWILDALNHSSWQHLHSIDVAAWTGIASSFMHFGTQGADQSGHISRSDVWRLRHDQYLEYSGPESQAYSRIPTSGWEPPGYMRLEDLEIEIRSHAHCSHKWIYESWSWIGPRHTLSTNMGYSSTSSIANCPIEVSASARTDDRVFDHVELEACSAIGNTNSKVAFQWCAWQTEKGFSSLVSSSRYDEPVEMDRRDRDGEQGVLAWLELLSVP